MNNKNEMKFEATLTLKLHLRVLKEKTKKISNTTIIIKWKMK